MTDPPDTSGPGWEDDPPPGASSAASAPIDTSGPGWEDDAPGQETASPTSGSGSHAAAFASGMLGSIPFAKDVAAGAVPLIAKGASYLPQNEDQKKALAGLPQSYTDARAALDANTKIASAAHPWTSLAGSVAGATALAPLMPASSIGEAAGYGAGYGGLTGAGGGGDLGERARSAAWGTGLGAIGGAAGGLLATPFKAANPEIAANRGIANQYDINLPRAVAGSPASQTLGHFMGATPFGGKIAEATNEAAQQTGSAITKEAQTIGGGTKGSAVDFAVPAIQDWAKQGFGQEAQRIYRPLAGLNGSQAKGPMTNATSVAQDLMDQAHNIGKTPAEAYTPAVSDALEALTRPGGMTFSGMNGLKTQLGKSASWDARGDDEGFKRLYGAVNDDVRAQAQAIGGNQGLVAYDQAGQQFQALLDRNKSIGALLGKRSDEQVYDAFARKAFDNVGGKGGDLEGITHVKNSIPEGSYNELVSGMVGGLGRDQGGALSLKNFANDWAKMSPEAKNTVFSTPGTAAVRNNLDEISRVAGMLQNAKPGSHLGSQLATLEGGVKLMEAAVSGEYGKAMTIGGALAGGSKTASFLASPQGSGMAAQAMRVLGQATRTGNPAQLTRFRGIVGRIGALTGSGINQSIQGSGQ